MQKIKILAISGSLKSSSSNSAILKALSQFEKENVIFEIYNELDTLPHFNPEHEDGTLAVKKFRSLLKNCDGLIISTPEYAFGVPGTLKNALDWTVSSGELNEKPVVAISASPMYEGGKKAMASLLLTLGALGTIMTETSHLSIPNIFKKISKQGIIMDEEMSKNLSTIYDHLLSKIKSGKKS